MDKTSWTYIVKQIVVLLFYCYKIYDDLCSIPPHNSTYNSAGIEDDLDSINPHNPTYSSAGIEDDLY